MPRAMLWLPACNTGIRSHDEAPLEVQVGLELRLDKYVPFIAPGFHAPACCAAARGCIHVESLNPRFPPATSAGQRQVPQQTRTFSGNLARKR